MSSTSDSRYSSGEFNMDTGDGGVKRLPRYTYEGFEHNFDVVRDTAGGLMCSVDSGPWQEFRNDMPHAAVFANIIIYYELEG